MYKNSRTVVQHGKDGVPESVALHVERKTIKLRDENIGEYLHDLRLAKKKKKIILVGHIKHKP